MLFGKINGNFLSFYNTPSKRQLGKSSLTRAELFPETLDRFDTSWISRRRGFKNHRIHQRLEEIYGNYAAVYYERLLNLGKIPLADVYETFGDWDRTFYFTPLSRPGLVLKSKIFLTNYAACLFN